MKLKVCREMMTALKSIQKCLDEGKLEKLINLAEYELGFRYRIYPIFTMPNREEYIIDVCNYVALAHINDIIKSASLTQHPDCRDFVFLKKLLRINWKIKRALVEYVFGDQSTYQDPAEQNVPEKEYTERMEELSERMDQKPMLKIEMCHLIYETGRIKLRYNYCDEAREMGLRLITYADGVSYAWIFLGRIMVCRADILEKRFKECEEKMEEIVSMIDMFKSDELKSVIERAFEVSGM